MKQQHWVLLAGLLLLGGFAVAAYLYDRQQVEERDALAQQHAEALIRDYSPRLGNPEAKVTIVEFFDPACETCKAFHPLVKQLMASYPDQVNLVLRYAAFHPGSDTVVKMLEAARLQGKYWETLEATLDAQPAWAAHGNPQPDRLWMRLGRTGLDFKKAREEMASTEIARRLAQDMADVKTMQVTKTPTFFVNGKPLPRFGYEQLQQLVRSEVAANY
jgi:protein-disulfide isomerase